MKLSLRRRRPRERFCVLHRGNSCTEEWCLNTRRVSDTIVEVLVLW